LVGEGSALPLKTVLILANSVRHAPNACVAGRELTDAEGKRSYGAWVRPVSNQGDGELSLQERWTAQNREVHVLDIVRMSLGDQVVDALQPENWKLASPPAWQVVATATIEDLKRAAESPPSLWDDPKDLTDRVNEVRIAKSPPAQSLYLVKIEEVLIRLSSEHYPERTRKQRRALFRHRGRDYNLAITDPTIEGRYGIRVPTPSEAAIEHRVRHACYVCVSLAHRSFQGHHYKLAAAIIDPEHL